MSQFNKQELKDREHNVDFVDSSIPLINLSYELFVPP